MLERIIEIPPFTIIRKINEKRFLSKLRKKNKNLNPTIVCNNCIGGIIYHNLGLKFSSPTVNLFFKEDYVEFAKNFEYYSKCELEEVKNTIEGGYNYPLGRIVPKDNEHPPITVHFMHYKSFEQAKEKWFERYSRVDYNNLYFIYEFYDDVYDEKLLYEFEKIPYKKIILTHKKFKDVKNSFMLSCYNDNKPVAKVMRYRGLSGKRYLDEFDYVSFLND